MFVFSPIYWIEFGVNKEMPCQREVKLQLNEKLNICQPFVLKKM